MIRSEMRSVRVLPRSVTCSHSAGERARAPPPTAKGSPTSSNATPTERLAPPSDGDDCPASASRRGHLEEPLARRRVPNVGHARARRESRAAALRHPSLVEHEREVCVVLDQVRRRARVGD